MTILGIYVFCSNVVINWNETHENNGKNTVWEILLVWENESGNKFRV